MENLVITFKYENGNINQIMSKSDFDKLVNMWGLDELKSILLDDEKNCLQVGTNPEQVSIDIYENARLIPVQSTPGTLPHLLGEPYTYEVSGTRLDNFLVLSN
jgi:hypothetical protein